MIVATAGHIDHGKTTLVKVLTGVDTDRLPQERLRGISIDLGFAYWRAPEGRSIGFVDVPGHERFVGNMLAGICSADFAMLVVAADDGVMPQTREHLHIVNLLGIGRGIALITKADRVDQERLEFVQRETRALLAGTSLQDARLLPVSAASGLGIEALRGELVKAASGQVRRPVEGRRLRYAVDRSFTVAGSGTVVTGTVLDGAIRVGDRLLVSPRGQDVRVRGLQKNGARAELALAGERCALNLAGVEVSQVQRGDWILHPELHGPTLRMDVELCVLAVEKHALRHWTPVHLHLGTRELMARVSLRRGESVQPGASAFGRLIADRPLVASRGDRFILRDQSARRTLGGGWVLDAWPDQRRLRHEARLKQLQALALPSAAEALSALAVCTPSGLDAADAARRFNLEPEAFMRLSLECGLVSIGRGSRALIFTPAQADARAVRKPTRELPENPEYIRLWQLAQPILRDAGLAGVTVVQLADALHAKELILRDLLLGRARAGETVRVTDDRFYLRGTMQRFIQIAREVAGASPGGRFTAGKFRDRVGIGRALSVQVLETLDRLGVTYRIGDVRVVRPTVQPDPSALSPQGGAMP